MELIVLVDNRIRLSVGGLKEGVIEELKRAFRHPNPDRAKKRQMRLRGWWVEPEHIETWGVSDGEMSVPRGGVASVRRVLEDNGYDLRLVDAREHGASARIPRHRRKLYPHQRRIVDAAIEREQCLLRSPTGSGKTSALIAIISQLSVSTLVVLHSRALLDQWSERLQAELGLEASQIGYVRGGKVKLAPITLAIQVTISRLAEDEGFRRYFGCVIHDETHMAPAKTFFAAIDAMPARYRFGASAYMKRKDRKEFLMRDLFGEVAVDVPRAELVGSGHILDVEIRAVPTDFAAPWYAEDRDFVRLVKEMALDPARELQIQGLVRDEVAAGEQVLVMAHEREHCMRIGQALTLAGVRAGYLLGGEESRGEFRATLEGLREGRVRVGVGTYKAIGTGVDLPRVGVAVATTPIAGNEQFFGQVRGRVCRTSEGKTAARLYVLMDTGVYAFRHLRNLVSWNVEVLVWDRAGGWTPARQWIRAVG